MTTSDKAQQSSYRSSFLSNSIHALKSPLLAILGALLIGMLLILISGKDPIAAFAALVDGAFGGNNNANLVATLRRSAPVVGMGISAAISLRAGFFNIGGEGQLVLGGLTAGVVATYLHLPGPVVIITAIFAAAFIGGLYALIPIFFELKIAFPILVSSLLLNYPAKYMATYLVKTYFRDISAGIVATNVIPKAVELPKLFPGSQLHIGIPIILLIVIASAIVIYRTVPGYEITMSGLNPKFAEYGGIDRKRLGYRVMFMSGCVAGIVGAVEVLGVHFRYVDGSLASPLYAWIGIMAALLSQFNPWGVLIAGFFFAAVKTGGYGMQRLVDVPKELSEIIQAVIIMLVSIRTTISFRKRSGVKR